MRPRLRHVLIFSLVLLLMTCTYILSYKSVFKVKRENLIKL